MKDQTPLIAPFKGSLVDLVVTSDRRGELMQYAASLPSIQLTRRESCDLEMLAVGAFSPLRGFMNAADLASVMDSMRTADGTLFPIPITLSTNDEKVLKIGMEIALRDQKNDLLAILKVGEAYEWDRYQFAESIFGTGDIRHPLVSELQRWGRFNIAGDLQVLRSTEYYDFKDLRFSPQQTRERLVALGRRSVVAFQTRNPLHRAHEEMTERAVRSTDGTLLLHPVVGMTRPGDIDHYTRVRTYQTILSLSKIRDRTLLALLPLAMRMAGPREAVWHCIIRRNYGASHMIVGRDHASPEVMPGGRSFFEPFAAQALAKKYSEEIGVKVVPFRELAYVEDERRYEEVETIPAGTKYFPISGKGIRKELTENSTPIPDWAMRPEVARILRDAHPPRTRQGVCLWFTGLSCAGKSSTAEIVASLLLAEGRRVTLLDGDVVRTNLSKGLGFSREDRDTNLKRIGFVAAEIVRHDGVVLCAAVSPYRQTRNEVRQMFEPGRFIEVFVDTPLEVCEDRDSKGMYANARAGKIKNFTGLDDVYEEPQAAEVVLDTVAATAEENALKILEHLRSEGFLEAAAMSAGGSV